MKPHRLNGGTAPPRVRATPTSTVNRVWNGKSRKGIKKRALNTATIAKDAGWNGAAVSREDKTGWNEWTVLN
jgi:hypothetical protein